MRTRTRNEEIGLTCRERVRAACVHTSYVPSAGRFIPRHHTPMIRTIKHFHFLKPKIIAIQTHTLHVLST